MRKTLEEELKRVKAVKREIKKRPRMRMHGASLRKQSKYPSGKGIKIQRILPKK
jgi:hypothetical protein